MKKGTLEQQQHSQKKTQTMHRILSEMKPYMGFLLLSILCAIVFVVFSLMIPIFIGQALDCMQAYHQVDFPGLLAMIRQMLLAIILAAIAQWLMNLINNHITYSITKTLRERAFESIAHMPVSKIDAANQGDLISRIIVDADVFSDGLLLGFSQLLTGVMTIVGTIGFMLKIQWKIALVVIALTPVSLFVARFIAKRTFQMFSQQARDRGELTDFIDERVMQQQLVRSLGCADETKQCFEEKNKALAFSSVRATFYSSLPNPSMRFVNSLIYASVGVAGAMLAIGGGLSIGRLTSFLGYAASYAKPFNEISGVLTEMQNAVACAQRLFELIDEAPEEEIADSMQQEEDIAFAAKGAVTFQQVAFSYDKEHPFIQNMNLNVAPGEHVAIVGPTGSGKTTLMNLLMRFYEVSEGVIYIDGVPIDHLKRDTLREQFGMVLQETWLFEGTILDNLRLAKPDAAEEEVVAAAKLSKADDFIKRLPNGYQTVFSSTQSQLSMGQKQLLCITRLMLHLPPMLILDEATSSIDTRTEQKIQEAFLKMMDQRTTFIVAHRLSTIQNADLILFMKEGRVVEQGNHEQLLRQNGEYAKMYYSQFRFV